MIRLAPYGIIVASVIAVFVLLDERAELKASIEDYRAEISHLSTDLAKARARIDAAAAAEEARAESERLMKLAEAEASLEGAEDGEIAEVLHRALDALR